MTTSTPFTAYSTTVNNTAELANALLAANSGITIMGNVKLNASQDGVQAIDVNGNPIFDTAGNPVFQGPVNFYDGSISGLGIGKGLLLTSGTTPSTINSSDSFGQDNTYYNPTTGLALNYDNGDADINAVVNSVFQTQSYDATTLAFDFTVADPNATSVTFDLVMGSDEYPEWVDSFVDSAVVIVNGVNYALFNHNKNNPLSVLSQNLAAGYFQNNAVDPTTGVSPFSIEYDGLSKVLKIIAPINAGVTNSIKIGIADTGDHVLDTGIFIANLSAGATPGSGVVATQSTSTTGNDTITGSTKDEYLDLQAGNDVAYAGAGDDIVVAGAGNDTIYGGSGNDQVEGDSGNDSIDGGAGIDTAVYAGISGDYTFSYDSATGVETIKNATDDTDTLQNVENIKFQDGTFNLANGILTGLVSSGTGGTVTTPINTSGSVVITGIASIGNTLTANVSDADGISAAGIIYTWQSSTNGSTWANIAGATTNTYAISSGDAGKSIQVVANYTDGKNVAESHTASKQVVAANSDNSIILLTLATLDGATIKTPLTTLAQNAIAGGVSPNEAMQYVKDVLTSTNPGVDAGKVGHDINIDSSVNLKNYDSYAVLQADPNHKDFIALNVEKLATQVAIITSLGGDDKGLALTQAILSNTTLNLTDTNDIASILGLDPNSTLVANIALWNSHVAEATNLKAIETEWQDVLEPAIKTKAKIADLSVHVNQAPIGFTTAELPAGLENTNYIIKLADLLSGFSDPNGDALSVSKLTSDSGTLIANPADGTWTYQPNLNFNGPVQLNYNVVDTGGLSAAASQLFVVEPAPNHSGSIVISGNATQGQTLTAVVSDIDGFDPNLVSYQWEIDENGNQTVFGGDTSDTFVLPQEAVGHAVDVVATYTDLSGFSEIIWSAATGIVSNVNDAPIGTVTIDNLTNAQQGDVLTVSNDLTDADGMTNATIVYHWQDANGNEMATGSSYKLTQANAGTQITAVANYTDDFGTVESVSSLSTNAIINVNDAPTGTVQITGAAIQGQALTASNTLADIDGLGTISYQWQVNGTDIIGATANTYTLTSVAVGKSINVTASYTDLQGTAESVSSASTANVANLPVPTDGKIINGTKGNDKLVGGDGNDSLYGSSGDDKLNGGAGDDCLTGGKGDDSLTGGTGADHFLFVNRDGEDRILDFNVSQGDVIHITKDMGIKDFADVIKHSHIQSNGVQIDFVEGKLLLVGVSIDALALASSQFIIG